MVCALGASLSLGCDIAPPAYLWPLALSFLDSMGGGAWPFLVGGAICLVNSDNERDLSLLTSYAEVPLRGQLLRGTMAV